MSEGADVEIDVTYAELVDTTVEGTEVAASTVEGTETAVVLVEGTETEARSVEGVEIYVPGIQGPPGASDRVSFEREANQILSGHRAVTPDVDGKVGYADPLTIGNQPVWVTSQAGDEGDMVEVVAYGALDEGSWAWVAGNVYLASSGVLTQVEPGAGALVVVAVATSPTSVFVDRQTTIDL